MTGSRDTEETETPDTDVTSNDSTIQPPDSEPDSSDTESPEESTPTKQDVENSSQSLSFFARIDNALFRLETVVVVTALIAMSVFVFTDVAFQLAVGMSQSDGVPLELGAILGFVGLMAFAATGREDDESGIGIGPRIGIALGAAAITFGLGYALLHLQSSTVYRFVLVVLAIPAAVALKDQKKWIVVFAVGVVIAFIVFGRLPAGFSWAQSYSLVLLLWVGFLGASIAAKERRHLRVDLMRKLCPEKYAAHFNALSYLVAGIFTSVVLYLGYIYMFGPDSSYLKPIWDAPAWLPEGIRTQLEKGFPLPDDASLSRRVMQVLFAPSEPGELPDWLKAGAIPVSMFLIAVRFFGHAVKFGGMAMRGEVFREDLAEGH